MGCNSVYGLQATNSSTNFESNNQLQLLFTLFESTIPVGNSVGQRELLFLLLQIYQKPKQPETTTIKVSESVTGSSVLGIKNIMCTESCYVHVPIE